MLWQLWTGTSTHKGEAGHLRWCGWCWDFSKLTFTYLFSVTCPSTPQTIWPHTTKGSGIVSFSFRIKCSLIIHRDSGFNSRSSTGRHPQNSIENRKLICLKIYLPSLLVEMVARNINQRPRHLRSCWDSGDIL